MFYIASYIVFQYSGSSGSLLQESSVSRCSLFGNDHIKTFDDSFYNFAGDCSYLLAGDCHKRSFTLLGEFELLHKIVSNEKCCRYVTWPYAGENVLALCDRINHCIKGS